MTLSQIILTTIFGEQEQPDSSRVVVRQHTRSKPVNPKREALHEQLRRELGRAA